MMVPHLTIFGNLPENRIYQCQVNGEKVNNGGSTTRNSKTKKTKLVDYVTLRKLCMRSLVPQFESLTQKMDELEEYVEERQANQVKTLKSFEKDLDYLRGMFSDTKSGEFTITQILLQIALKGNFDEFEIYNNHTYIFSKRKEHFDIGYANQMCKLIGGYLAELDSNDETDFLIKRIKGFPSRVKTYFTGGTKRGKHYWYNYNSNKRTPHLRWGSGKPDNYRGIEYCMAIHNLALDDLPCGFYGKYICEVALTKEIPRE
ncbi:C-type lectin-related protein 1 [Elysia marginata]|uniref:C-type lectin-related protein 1 n=1 Tax=Elysia marginata TaxID=1093978 RepID=A0AAV4GLP7_9GAST|nr:C-type lectin-related protein 1 [Elysia marginata]